MNRSLLRRLVSEPLLQLLVAGAAIFGGYALLSPSGARASRAIVIDAEFVRSLSRGLARRLGHAPTRAQLERAVERHVEEELYVRGAVALGLARGDAIVRRRLAQKMRFVAEDFAPTAERQV